MEFSAYASKETSALIERVITESSQASLKRVEALRTALDSASKALEAALATTPDTAIEVTELVAKLTKAATTEGDARLKRLSSEARKITETLRADLEEQTKQKEELAATLAETQSAAALVRVELEAAQNEAEQTRQQLAEAVAAQQALDAAREEAIAASDEEATARAIAEAELLEIRGELESARGIADARLREMTGELESAQAIADAKFLEVSGQLEIIRAEADAQVLDLTRQLETARAEAARAIAAGEEEARARGTAQAELQALLDQLETTRAEAARALAAGDQAADARASVESELQGLRSQLDAARAEVTRTTTLLDGAMAEKGKLAEALSTAKSATEAAEGKVSAAATRLKTTTARLQALEREREESASAVAELEERVRAGEGEGGPSAVPVMDNLLRGLEALSTAGTIDDVLTTLIEQLAGEFARVALFKVKGNRLEGAHQIGFALTNDIGKVMMPLAMDSVLTRAVTSGSTERVSGDDLLNASGLPFGGSPAWAVAAPIVVDGESIAVVYADDSGLSRPDRQPAAEDLSVKFAEAMRQFAVALLTRMSHELKGQAELRAYAGSLFDEVEAMYRADEAAGKTGTDLQNRLHANLEYARSIFAHRTAYESPAAAELLEAQLKGMLDLHRESAFGRDLATVSAWGADGKAAAAPRAATAS
jgi:hypothetical protein